MGEKTARADILGSIFSSDYHWLMKRLRSHLANKAEVEDVASEAFVRLAALPDLLNVAKPRAMLTTLAQRVMYESWRRRDLERAYLAELAAKPEQVHPSAEEMQAFLDSLLLIDMALDGLPTKAREAFLYSQIDGLTYQEIADILGVSFSMVRKYITQALTQCYMVAEQCPL